MKRAAFPLLLLLLTACVPADGAHTVTLIADGQTRSLTTEALVVRDLLVEAGVALDEDDRVEPAENMFIEDGLIVRVIRVEVRIENEQREIPFERRTVRDTSIPLGETRLLEAGVTGLEELSYRVTIEDGVEVDRQLARRVTLREPRTEIILVGAQMELAPVPITGTVAYIANRNAWVIRTTSPNRRRLTHTSDLDGRVFALSPDGSYLMFTRASTDAGALNTLWMVDAVVADAEPVRLVGADGVLWADWAPDCRGAPDGSTCRIAYTTATRTESSPGWEAANDLWIARPRARDGHVFNRVRVVKPSAGGAYGRWGTSYAWSPDGLWLAYARADQVGVVRVSDGRQTALALFPPYRTYAQWAWTPSVSWSPEGEFIVAVLHGPAPTGGDPEDSPVFDIWALAASGTISAELASETGMWASPLYAPEGDWIAFGRARSPYASAASGYDLYVMDRDGSNRRLLFPSEGEPGLRYYSGAVAWGPGGEHLIVVYQGDLYRIAVEDGAAQPLTAEGNVTTVRWEW